MLPLIILAGPTTSRKSDTAIALAEKLDLEVINADSMQVYKYFDIGTAKPSVEIRRKVVHHLIDILEPAEEFNAFDFKIRAVRHIQDIIRRDKIPVLVGGTGLYIKVLTEDHDCGVHIEPETRGKVKSAMKKTGLRAAYEELRKVDPESAKNITANDPVRIERALAVYRQSGRKLSEFREAETPPDHDFPIQTFFIDWDRKELYDNINRRVDRMIEAGLVVEVKSLLDRGYSPGLKPLQSIGYSQMVRHLQGALSLDQAIHEIKRETRHYAKRQITWFKKVPDLKRIPAANTDTPESLRDKVLALLPQAASLMIFIAVLLGMVSDCGARDFSSFADGIELFRQQEFSKAENRFRAVRNSSPGTLESKRALYLLGLAHARQNEFDDAVKLFQDALKELPQIEDYIRLDLAQALFDSGQPAAALEQVDTLLKNIPQTLTYPRAQRLRFDCYRKLEQPEKAVQVLRKTLKKITRQNPKKAFQSWIPETMFQLAHLHRELQQNQKAYSLYRDLVVNYPTHAVTQEASAQMRALASLPEVSAAPLTLREHSRRIRGLLDAVRYPQVIEETAALRRDHSLLPGRFHFFLARAYKGLRQRNRVDETLKTFLKRYPEHSRVQEARYTLGRNLWNLDRNQEAISYLQKILAKETTSEWAIKAHYLMGRIHESDRQTSPAIEHYLALVQNYGDDEYAQWAAWRLGWIYYHQENYRQAFSRFNQNTKRFPHGIFIEHNLFWKAKSAEKDGNGNGARQAYQDAGAGYPYTYYGIRARQKLQDLGIQMGDTQAPPFMKISFKKKNRLPPRLNRPLTRKEKFRYVRALALSAIGLFEEARWEVQQLEGSVRKNLRGTLWLSELYIRSRSYADSVRLLQLYKDYKTKKNEKDLSQKFWKSFYPLAYTDIIHEKSRIHGLDPYFVKGLIRQESLFDTWSLSRAGARGLMQIMPETGERVYEASKKSQPYDPDDLYKPDFNIELGMQYLRQLQERFGKNEIHLLISYNAGPHVLKNWLQRFSGIKDPDVFIESIPYPETRRYVQNILRNHGIYKIFYPSP